MGQQESKTRGSGGMKTPAIKLLWGKFRMHVVCAFSDAFRVPIKIREEYIMEHVMGMEHVKVKPLPDGMTVAEYFKSKRK